MSDTKPIQISKVLHRELKELAGWNNESLRTIVERGVEREVRSIREKRNLVSLKTVE